MVSEGVAAPPPDPLDAAGDAVSDCVDAALGLRLGVTSAVYPALGLDELLSLGLRPPPPPPRGVSVLERDCVPAGLAPVDPVLLGVDVIDPVGLDPALAVPDGVATTLGDLVRLTDAVPLRVLLPVRLGVRVPVAAAEALRVLLPVILAVFVFVAVPLAEAPRDKVTVDVTDGEGSVTFQLSW